MVPLPAGGRAKWFDKGNPSLWRTPSLRMTAEGEVSLIPLMRALVLRTYGLRRGLGSYARYAGRAARPDTAFHPCHPEGLQPRRISDHDGSDGQVYRPTKDAELPLRNIAGEPDGHRCNV